MGSNDAVSVYQAEFEKCHCSTERCDESSSPVDPVVVASNLLLDNHKSRKLRIVSPREFRPWFDSTTLVPFSFKFQPPKLPVVSVKKSNQTCHDKGQSSPLETGCLLEFLPVYSGKSCLQYELTGYSYSQSDSNEGVGAKRSSNLQVLSTEDHGVPMQSNHWPILPSAGNEASGKNIKLWCASAINGKSRKEKHFVLEKCKNIILQQVKEKYKLNYYQRGKWIISSLKGNNLTVEQLWKKVCSLIKESHLPHCNAKLQKTQGEVWVYCDFEHSLKVRSTLEKALGNVGPFLFCVHPLGAVIEL